MYQQVKILYFKSDWIKRNSKASTTLWQQQNENDNDDYKYIYNSNSINNDNLINIYQNWRTRHTNNCNKNLQLTNENSSSSSRLVKRQGSSGSGYVGLSTSRIKHKMANTLSVMTNVLRNVVSKQRIRYKEKGFNLDLAYICDNIIAMGYPADNIEKIYRNRLEDVYKFLEENHHDHYKIYNLCLERSYDVNKFHGRVAAYPFEDHNPPTIELIQRFCVDVDAWLKANPNHVAAIHCKAGKGRTGTMICCYLLYSNQHQTAESALAHYGEKRTKDRKGVTIPSQRRYVHYFAKLLRSNLSYERRYLEFFEIRFSEAQLLYSQCNVHCAISALQDSESCIKVLPLQNLTIDFRKSFTLDMKNFGLRVSGDIKVELSHKTSKRKIFHFWFNTFFVGHTAELEGEGENAKLVYTLNKFEIDDAHKDKEHKMYTEDFKVQLAFYNEGPETNINRSNDNHSSMQHTYTQSSRVDNSLVATTGPIIAPTLTTAADAATFSKTTAAGSGLLSDIQFVCDQNTNTLLYNAAATALAPVQSCAASESMGGKTPYTHLNHHEEDVVERRQTSHTNYNNIRPHTYIGQKQQLQQQQYRRSDNLKNSSLQQQQQTDLKTLDELSSCNNHYTRHKQQQQQDLLAISAAAAVTTTTISGTTFNQTNNNNNTHNNNNSSSHSQSNISNSSNSSFNSHITSVSSSASMASSANVYHHDQNHVEKNHHDNDDDDNGGGGGAEDNDDDEDEDNDDDEVDDNEEDWESGESAVVKPLPSTTTSTTTTTIRLCKKLVTSSTATTTTSTTITFIPTTTTTTISSTTTITTENQKKNLPNLFPSSVSNPQQKQCYCYLHKMHCNNCSSYCKIGDIYLNDNGNNHIINVNNHIHNNDDDDDDNDNNYNDDGDINPNNIKEHNDYDNRATTKFFKFDNNNKIKNDDIQAINIYDDDDNDNDEVDSNKNNFTKNTHFNKHKNSSAVDNDAEIIISTKTAAVTLGKPSSKRSNKLSSTSNLTARYKFMHLLSTSKASTKVMATKHSYFKRKSLKSIDTTTIGAAASAAGKSNSSTIKTTSSNCYNLASGGDAVDGDEKIELRTRTISTGSTGGCGGGVGGNLAKASKLKLKMSFTKSNSKLKWTQRFHWLQNYVRSPDARADLRKSFGHSTSSQRLNSNSSNSKKFNTFNKPLSETTVTTTSTTAATNLNKNSKIVVDYENLGAYETSSMGSLLQENCFLVNPEISVVPVNDDNDEDYDDNDNSQMREFSTNIEHDYYSSICDNQLSFNNSPCKSPRSLVENMKIINHHSTQHLQEQQQNLPPPLPPSSSSSLPQQPLLIQKQCKSNSDKQHQQQVQQKQQNHSNPSVKISNNDATSKVVVVAARPANKQAIGFIIDNNPIATTAILSTNDSGSNSSGYATTTTTNSGSSIYWTPPTSRKDDDDDEIDMIKVKQSPFVFPSISAEITELAHVLKTTTVTSNEHGIGNGRLKIHNQEEDKNDKEEEPQHKHQP